MSIKKFTEKGFTLIELLIVVVILAVVLTLAVIQYQGVRQGTQQSLVQSRITVVADAQHKYRTALGKRRYGSLCYELKKITTPSGALLPDSVARFDEKCQPTPDAGGWLIYDDIESETFDRDRLKSGFGIYARKQDEKQPRFCMFEDLVLREAEKGESCSRSSVAVDQ